MSNNLTKKQHVYPSKSLQRFINVQGNIEVYRFENRKIFTAKPSDGIFTVKREWDQRAERGFGKGIEDNFQGLVEYCIKNNLRKMPFNGNHIVNSFYALWHYRSCIKEYDEQIPKASFTPDPLTEEQKITLELKHVSFVDSDGDMPQRMKRGIVLQGGIISLTEQFKSVQWFMVKSPQLELVVPDNPVNSLFIPVNPNLCIVAEHNVPELSKKEALHANFKMATGSQAYYCGRNLSKCFNA
jgi:hypothetical protein